MEGHMVPPDPQAPKDARKPDTTQGSNQDLWRYLGLGTQLAVTVGLFALLGWWLDRHFGWAPWGLVVTGSVGIAAGLYGFLKDVLR